MIKIEVNSADVSTRSGNKNGRDWTMRTQEAWAHTVGRNGMTSAHPEKIQITLDEKQDPYTPGFYTLQPQSLYVGDYGTLRLGTPVLKRLEQAVKAAA